MEHFLVMEMNNTQIHANEKICNIKEKKQAIYTRLYKVQGEAEACCKKLRSWEVLEVSV